MKIKEKRNAKKKLIFFVNDVDYFLLHWRTRAVAAQKSGYSVHLIAPLSGNLSEVYNSGFWFHPISLSRKSSFIWTELATLMGIARYYRLLKPDIVHHITIKPVIYGGLVARFLRVPSVTSTIPGLGYVFITPPASEESYCVF